VVFSVGIGTGSLLCEVMSRRHVEIGLVPLGAIGMTLFSVDLYFASTGLPPPSALVATAAETAHASITGAWTLAGFVAQPAHWRVMADLFGLSLFAGLYSVPMYALIQMRSQATHRARIIAANNILNALFMIASSLLAGLLLSSGASIPQVFLATGLANVLVAGYIFLLVPEYLLRFIAFLMTHVVYRVRLRGDAHLPVQGAAIVAANHVSYVDAVLLMAISPRPIRFLMDHRIFAVPVLGWLFRLAKAIPVAPQKEDPAAYERAFEQARAVLAEGDLLGIFPEGGITRDGQLQPFKGGIMKIVASHPAPVVPVSLRKLWGSTFSRIEGGQAMARPFRRGIFSRVEVLVAEPIGPDRLTPEGLQQVIQQGLDVPLPRRRPQTGMA
jgi:1-acyl-sn-glycerol-3-phosphate acyltransferase